MIRLDKYLKLTQLIKRRTIAQEMIDVGAVRINNRKVKSAADVKNGDQVEIAFPRRLIIVEVLVDDETSLKRHAETAYKQLGEGRVEPEQDPWTDRT